MRGYLQRRLNVSDCRPRKLDWSVRLNVVWVPPDLSLAYMGPRNVPTLIPLSLKNQQDCDLHHKISRDRTASVAFLEETVEVQVQAD